MRICLSAQPGHTPGLDDNLIIHGDNLHALKALLPAFGGRVQLIYIDPPYNTGNKEWKYLDNVAHPMLQAWLSEEVDREDLTRHDKWLCMMTPRLKLLKELLKEDGVILVSIDDFEAHRLRMLMDEIFGEENFVAQLVWEKSRKNDAKFFSVGHEYMLCYPRSLETLRARKTVWHEPSQARWRSGRNTCGFARLTGTIMKQSKKPYASGISPCLPNIPPRRLAGTNT